MKGISKLVWKPYNAEILSFCDGKHSISEIQEQVNLTYKSVFLRIKELEEKGILKKGVSKPYTPNKPLIKKELKKEVMNGINEIIRQTEFLKEFEKEKTKESKRSFFEFLEVLEYISEKRFVDRNEFFEYFGNRAVILWHKIPLLRKSAMVKDRYEITKKGKKFLKEKIPTVSKEKIFK